MQSAHTEHLGASDAPVHPQILEALSLYLLPLPAVSARDSHRHRRRTVRRLHQYRPPLDPPCHASQGKFISCHPPSVIGHNGSISEELPLVPWSMSLVPIAQVSIAVTWTTTLLQPGSTLVLYAQSLRKDWRVRCARRARRRCQLNIIPRRPLSQQITPSSTTLINPADMCTMTQAAGTSCMRKSHPSPSQKILSHSWQDPSGCEDAPSLGAL